MGNAILNDLVLARRDDISSEYPFAADVVGYDLTGFSRAVADTVARDGATAAEQISDALSLGEATAAAALAPMGYSFAETTGDGAVFVRSEVRPEELHESLGPPAALIDAMAAVAAAYLEATGLALRWAHARGVIMAAALDDPAAPQAALWIGAPLVALHRALAAGARNAAGPGTFGDVAAVRDLQAKAARGEICDLTIVFCRLLGDDAVAGLTGSDARRACAAVAACCTGTGGRFARLSLDDKGLLARIEFDGAGLAARRTAHDATAFFTAGLGAAGFAPAFGLAAGPVYRGPAGRAGANTHGVCVNLAAKRAGAALPKEILADPSFTVATTASVVPAQATTTDATGLTIARSEVITIDALLNTTSAPILIEGVAGIGKSEALRQLAARAALAGRTCLATSCRLEGRLSPLGALIALARVLAHQRGLDGLAHSATAGLDGDAAAILERCVGDDQDLAAAIAAHAGAVQIAALGAALVTWISRAADANPCSLFVDDVQFIDFLSMRALTRLGAHPAVHLAAARRSPATATDTRSGAPLARSLDAVIQEREALAPNTWRRVHLAGLEDDAIAALVASSAPGDPTITATACAIAGGNPLLAVQAALALQDGALDDPADLGLERVIAGRLSDLNPSEMVMMRAAAATGRPLSAAMLEGICARVAPDVSVHGAAERLLARRLLAVNTSTGGVAFTPAHGLLEEACRRRMPSTVRRAFALAAVRVLDSSRRSGALANVSFTERANLWRTAGATGRAAILFEYAGRHALELGAHGAALDCLDSAFAVAGATTSLRPARWRADRSQAAWGLGRISLAANDAAESLKARHNRRYRRRNAGAIITAAAIRAETGQFQGDLGAIFSGNWLAFRFASDAGSRRQALGRGYAFLGYIAGLLRLQGLSHVAHQAGVACGQPGIDMRPAGFTLAARAVLDLAFGRWRDAEATLLEARATIVSPPEPHLAEVVETLLGLGRNLSGDWRGALAHFDRLADMAAARGHAMHRGWAAYARAMALIAGAMPQEALDALSVAAEWLADGEDVQSRLICAGLRPQALWALQRWDEAADAAIAAAALHVPPTNFGSLEGYGGPPHILAMAAAAAKDRDNQRLRAAARRAQAPLNAFAMVFPIGRPRAAIVRAWLALPANPRAAYAHAHKALMLADHLAMPTETAYAQSALRAAHALSARIPLRSPS